MPVTRLLPVAWYETPNIHHLTVADFRDLWKSAGSRWRAHGFWRRRADRPGAANWRAEHAVFLLSRP
jgi:hypothetical protein